MKSIKLTLKQNSTTPTFSLETIDTKINGKIEDLISLSEEVKKQQMFLVWNLLSKPIELEVTPSDWDYKDSLKIVLNFYNLNGEITKIKENDEVSFRLFV